MEGRNVSMAASSARPPLALMILGLALAAGCATPHIGTTASSFLRRAREETDPNLRHLAYTKLADPNCYDDEALRIEAVQTLSKAIEDGKEPIVARAVICRTLGEIGRPEARPALLAGVEDADPVVRAAACRALGKVGLPEDAVALGRVMASDRDPDCRVAAIEGIRNLKTPDPRVLVLLADALENPDPAIRLAAYETLQVSTGQNLPPEATAWKEVTRSALTAAASSPPRTPEAIPTPETIRHAGSPHERPTRR